MESHEATADPGGPPVRAPGVRAPGTWTRIASAVIARMTTASLMAVCTFLIVLDSTSGEIMKTWAHWPLVIGVSKALLTTGGVSIPGSAVVARVAGGQQA